MTAREVLERIHDAGGHGHRTGRHPEIPGARTPAGRSHGDGEGAQTRTTRAALGRQP